ncbi:hypothetical protein D0C36_08655 [Mucilaginibacter conchicola]|uniref:Uncharacterized protein n=1 Tax=Mucilaginibacter conchicola TaxID=2303333 RepID=A0A372P0C4_9SPHI|nr:hypothetical protein D0C36_08655 [Mucilaginibacter conchicola]
MVIPGYLIIHGDGLLSIMVAGDLTTIMAGNGYQVTSGHPPGLAGEMAAVTMAGHQCSRVLI